MDINNWEALTKVFKNLAEVIKEYKDTDRRLSRYDYYRLCGIPFRKALTVIYKLHERGLITKREYYLVNNYIDKELLLGASRNKDFILRTHYQFGEYVISDNEKTAIWNSLNDMGLEDKYIDDLLFSGAVRAYALEKGLIKKKTK